MKFCLLIFFLFINLYSSYSVGINTTEKQLQNAVEPLTFADIVEPLIPTVVNIYTEQARQKKENLRHPFNEFKEMFKNNDVFKDFELPFFFDENYSNPGAISLGSGFIIEKTGYIVTNNHVVANAKKINVKLFDNTEVEAKIVGTDKKTDLALLKIDVKKELPFAQFGEDKKSRIGDWVIAIGNPFGLNHTVTKGIISSKARDVMTDSDGIVNNYVQTDAPINKGNSGGPLFNLSGQVIGVNTSIYSTSGSNAGVGFAIPSETVKKIIEQLKKFGQVSRILLDIVIQPLTPEIAEGLGIKEQKGVLVTEVKANGAGHKAGLKPGDIIIELNNKIISSTRELQVLVAETEINTAIKLLVLRNNQRKELSTIISPNLLNATRQLPILDNTQLSINVEINKVTFADLNEYNIEKYHINPKTKGVVIVDISKLSNWAPYLKVGDIIINVNQQEVTKAKDIERIYKSTVSIKQNIIFMIKRRNSSVFLALPIKK